MIINEVHCYLQYLKLPSTFSFNLEKEGLFSATYKHLEITVVGEGKSKKIAKEEACKKLKLYLQLLVKEKSQSIDVEDKLKNLVTMINQKIMYVESVNDNHNIQVKCIVGNYESCGVAVISELAKVKAMNSMIKILSFPINDNFEEIKWVDMLKFLDKSFFKTLLYQICSKKSWDLSFKHEKSNDDDVYHVSCNIKATIVGDSSAPYVEDIVHTSISRIEGEYLVSKEICLKYFDSYNDNIHTLMKNQLNILVKKFYYDGALNYDVEEVSQNPVRFKCVCKFSKLITEGIHIKKKKAEGIAAYKMLQKLFTTDKNNDLSNDKAITNKPIEKSIQNSKNTNNNEENNFSINLESLKNIFINYHFYFKNIEIKNFSIYQAESAKYIFTYKYTFLFPDSNVLYCRRLFGIGLTVNEAIQDGCCNLLTAITMKQCF
uniref:Col_cuticle_N domain-containing protein n=1 Tax=Strongyloides stercoralis TaxID=6248 RepID=A0A0K0ECQ5_STRER